MVVRIVQHDQIDARIAQLARMTSNDPLVFHNIVAGLGLAPIVRAASPFRMLRIGRQNLRHVERPLLGAVVIVRNEIEHADHPVSLARSALVEAGQRAAQRVGRRPRIGPKILRRRRKRLGRSRPQSKRPQAASDRQYAYFQKNRPTHLYQKFGLIVQFGPHRNRRLVDHLIPIVDADNVLGELEYFVLSIRPESLKYEPCRLASARIGLVVHEAPHADPQAALGRWSNQPCIW